MDPRLNELADAVAEILANRWLEQEQRRADQLPNQKADPDRQKSTGRRKPTAKNAMARMRVD